MGTTTDDTLRKEDLEKGGGGIGKKRMTMKRGGRHKQSND